MELARRVLSTVIQKYDIDEPNRLEELIFAGLREKEQQDSEYKKRIREKDGIILKKEFDRILLDYRLRYDDAKVFKIPWSRYFVFVDVSKKATIDGVYITAEVVSVAFDTPIEIVQNGWSIDSDDGEKRMTLQEFLVENSIGGFNKNLFSLKALNAMHCEQRFNYRDTLYSFNFDYSNERSNNFEFQGKL
jgi:hypothetical protein